MCGNELQGDRPSFLCKQGVLLGGDRHLVQLHQGAHLAQGGGPEGKGGGEKGVLGEGGASQ